VEVALRVGVSYSLKHGECQAGGQSPPFLTHFRSVKLLSGEISHRKDGSQVSRYLFTLGHFVNPLQFAHPASIFTVIFLAITAVAQILCLNRGLRVYDSTLVVPVFYGVVGLSAQPIASAHRVFSTPQAAS
jgi:hypothetical protein